MDTSTPGAVGDETSRQEVTTADVIGGHPMSGGAECLQRGRDELVIGRVVPAIRVDDEVLAQCPVGWVGLRDSKLGDASPLLAFNLAEWRAMLAAARDGQFDA